MFIEGVCTSPILFVLATQPWAIKIRERTGIVGIQMNCGMTEFWNGATGVMLLLKIHIHVDTRQLSVRGQATISERRKDNL